MAYNFRARTGGRPRSSPLAKVGSYGGGIVLSSNWAVVIPVGVDVYVVDRLHKLLASLLRYETRVQWIVLVDDDPRCRKLERHFLNTHGCEVVSIGNPRRSSGIGYLGGLYAGVMNGLNWVWTNTDATLCVKLDTDSLVIRPFYTALHDVFIANPSVGQVGVIGRTCNRADPTFGFETRTTSPIVKLARTWEQLLDVFHGDVQRLLKVNNANSSLKWCDSFRHVYRVVRIAESQGYHNLAYCQGGAYALSRDMLSRLASFGCFEEAMRWAELGFGEDVIMGMQTVYVGMQMLDLSRDGDPFGLHWKGLPFSPAEILDRGFSIIHSLRNDRSCSEAEIYSFFGF
jgi:hypothetical protein